MHALTPAPAWRRHIPDSDTPPCAIDATIPTVPSLRRTQPAGAKVLQAAPVHTFAQRVAAGRLVIRARIRAPGGSARKGEPVGPAVARRNGRRGSRWRAR
eukprot:5739418-Prymnesium_polylepis.2